MRSFIALMNDQLGREGRVLHFRYLPKLEHGGKPLRFSIN